MLKFLDWIFKSSFEFENFSIDTHILKIFDWFFNFEILYRFLNFKIFKSIFQFRMFYIDMQI